MINICTVSDKNYLAKGLTLYESLKKFDIIKLHYLCIDDFTFDKISSLNDSNLIPYNVKTLLVDDKDLYKLFNEEYKYFCWSLASYFTNYIMSKENVPLFYIDSDIYFHDSIKKIIDVIGEKDLGIFRHRQFELNQNRPEGLFNVGVLFFRNSDIGKHILKWWAYVVLKKQIPNLATCGDQKYLDEFPNMCPDELIYIDEKIGHGAPWLWQLYDFSDYLENGNIIWNGEKQKLIFTHFSQFKFTSESYTPSSMHHIYTPLCFYQDIKELKEIYDEYYNELKQTIKKYGF